LPDDPRIKRVLKRYAKDSQFSDASIELEGISTEQLQRAFGRAPDDPLYRPMELAWPQIEFFGTLLGMEMDSGAYDYYLHSYVRKECVTEVFADKTRPYFPGGPAPEGLPPIPVPPGKVWLAVRPKDGKEQFLQFDE